jgi:hypothetical protein
MILKVVLVFEEDEEGSCAADDSRRQVKRETTSRSRVPTKSQQLQTELRSLVTTYRAIQERQESWVKLNEVMRYEDYVYPLLLDNLP